MNKSLFLAPVLAFAILLLAPMTFSQTTGNKKDNEVKEINAAVASTGDKIRGPRRLRLTHVNRIRYRVAIKSKTTFTAGPSLALPFIPQVTAPAAPAAASEGGQSADDRHLAFTAKLRKIDAERANGTEQQFREIEEAISILNDRKVVDIEIPISENLRRLRTAADATNGFVSESDARLGGVNGPDEVLRGIPAVLNSIESVNTQWPDAEINTFLGDVARLEDRIRSITDQEWLRINKSRFDASLDRLKLMSDRVVELSHNGKADSPAERFDQGLKVLQLWKEILTAAKAQGSDYFVFPDVEFNCSFAFDQNKETVVTLVKQDRLDPATTASEQELITVICSSPFSVSAGFGFSSINEQEFVFVPSTKTVTENGQTTEKVISRFGFKNNSSFRPIPLVLLNTRFYEFNDDWALHFSAGAGVDIKTGEAGSDVEFIVGPSVSFRRSMFITGGLHVGRVPKLAGGFVLGEEVPEGIDQPPVEKAWKNAFILTFTYKIR